MAFPSTGILLDPAGLGNAGPPPSGSFTTSVGAGLKIASGKIAPNATNDYQGAAWTSPFSVDMEAHVRIATLPTLEETLSLGCVVRLQTASNANSDHYEIVVNRQTGGNDELQLYKVATSGTYTFLVGYILSGELQVNDQIGIAAYGSLIVGFYNGSAVMTVRDTVVTAGGCAALMYYINGLGEFGAFGGGNVARKLRLYLPSSGAPAISPAFDAAWGDTEDADRIAAVSSPSNTAMTDKTCDEAVSTNPLNVLARQYIYGPLTAGWKVEGVVRGVIRCLESNSAADFMAALKIRGVDSAGANPSTLLDMNTAALSNELGTSAASRLFPRNWTSPILTPWTVPAGGGYLVIEVGVRSVNSSTTNRTATLRFGDTTSNSDRTEDETATDDFRPWIEFSDVGAVSTIADRDGSAAAAATASGQSGPTQGRVASASGVATASGASAARQGRAGSSSASSTSSGQSADANLLENSKIAFPSDGVLWGSYQWMINDLATFETVSGIPASHYSEVSGNWASGAMSYVSGHPRFNATVASTAWNAGKLIVVQAYNLCADPTDDEHPSGFTVDQLLAGAYDSNLSTFADDLRAFGKPCFIQCGREPNGVGYPWFGGWGPDGDEDTAWAITNEDAYENFVPPAVPSGAPGDLYADCSGPTIPDGIGRLKAGQRYIHDFLVRREGLNFLTFDSQGFTCHWWKDPTDNQILFDSLDYVGHESYAVAVLEDCNDPAKWFPGIRWCDCWSLTFYTLDYYDAWWSWLSGSDILRSSADWLTSFDHMLDQIAAVNALPVLLAEFGLCDGMNENTSRRASRVTDVLPVILNDYPQVKAISNWSDLRPPEVGAWTVADSFPYLCLIQPGTLEATALQAVIAAYPTKFHSYAQLTNGDTLTDGLAERDGTSSGAGTASGVSADLEARTGSGVGTSTATGQSAATQGRQGTASGAATATGQAADIESRQGTSTAQGSATGVAGDLESRTGTAAGSVSADGIAGSTESRIGTSAGQGVATGASAVTQGRQGTSVGAGAATGTSGTTVGSVGTAAGTGLASGTDARVDAQTASSAGAASASGVSGKTVGSGSTVAGQATVTGDATDAGAVGEDGTSAGVGFAIGQSARIQQVDGTSAGSGTATSAHAVVEGRTASAQGQGAASSNDASIIARSGAVAGAVTVTGLTAQIESVDGTAGGGSTVDGQTQSTEERVYARSVSSRQRTFGAGARARKFSCAARPRAFSAVSSSMR